MDTLTADTVPSLLRDGATRAGTLEALEQHEAPIGRTVSLAAAPVLYDLLAADATAVDRDDFDRVGMLLARLCVEALPDPSAVVGAALGQGRYAAVLRSEGSVLAQALQKPASEVTRADARSFACSYAWQPLASAKGFTKPVAAAGFAKTADFYVLYMGEDRCCK